MSDRRYSTAAWQRVRRAILYRDGYQCQIGGPGCTTRADTVDHRLPSSTHPHLFYAAEYLRAACRRCNFSGGAQIAADNRTARQLVEHLRQVVAEQREQIEDLLAELAQRSAPSAERRAAYLLKSTS